MPVTHRRLALLLVLILAICASVSIATASVRTKLGRSESSTNQLRVSRPVQADARGIGSALPADADAPRMEQVIQSYVSGHHFMGSVLVARGNEIILDKGYGFANLEWDIPNSPATKFRLGSITKQFTAASILLLEERGKLSVDDPVKKYMPDAPAAWDKITIFNLLTHTSGIPNFTSFPDYASLEPFTTTPAQLVKAVSRQASRFPAWRKNELQQFRIRAAGISDREDQRREL